jgi:hypothetical protein
MSLARRSCAMKNEPEPSAMELLLAAAALCGSASISIFLLSLLMRAVS